MIDRPSGGERAILVHIHFSEDNMQENLLEFKELTRSSGMMIEAVITGSRSQPEAKYFVGLGKANEIREAVVHHEAQIVIFNHALTPAQERNLEKLLHCRVLDRTGLILEIFAQRARSFEGKLQVELAYLKHLSTRLVRGWTHLERQRGGIGLRGGPGETQLEVDRRLIRKRIQLITARLKKVKQQRLQSRQARQKAVIPTIALVGYTNAGKSTLFNALSDDTVFVADQLFATLDPILRRIHLPQLGPVIIADTVGFIRHLPHDLVEAFHATLEEVAAADLLLHVVDRSDERRIANIEQVNHVLKSIEANTVPQLLVFNKVDLVEGIAPGLLQEEDKPRRVAISAMKKLGLEDLKKAIVDRLSREMVEKTVILTPQEAKVRAALYELDAVIQEKIDDAGQYHLKVRLPLAEYKRLLKA